MLIMSAEHLIRLLMPQDQRQSQWIADELARRYVKHLLRRLSEDQPLPSPSLLTWILHMHDDQAALHQALLAVLQVIRLASRYWCLNPSQLRKDVVRELHGVLRYLALQVATQMLGRLSHKHCYPGIHSQVQRYASLPH